jgi:site-specific recombinase XerD
MDRATKAAGLSRLKFHELRHSFASQLAISGVPMKGIQELLGHSTMEMIMRYAHLSPEARRSYVDRLDHSRTDRLSETAAGVVTAFGQNLGRLALVGK